MKHKDVFDAPIDAGTWMPVLGGPQPLIWRGGGGPGPIDDRLYLLNHIADGSLTLRATRFVARYDVRYVFYGAGARPGAQRHLDLARLLDDPHLRLVYTSAPACDGGRAATHTGCLPTASYVFAIV
jgi:hypothetical protein